MSIASVSSRASSPPGTILPEFLEEAALAVHAVLEQHSLRHFFIGGWQFCLLGFDRGTKDIDVEVEKPLIHGFEKVYAAFKSHPDFMVIDGRRTDAIRAIYSPHGGVGIDIFMRKGRMPRRGMNISIQDHALPFLTPTHLLIEKIRTAGERSKDVDSRDIRFMFLHYEADIDLKKVRKKLTPRDIALAVKHHPGLDDLLAGLGVV
ncbi:hypothetical protein BOTBODRAFT_177613 [Botryobasidium botryosum FD-172 SS1]|uniref:Poly A polymerase head domain-containing protein n=1 Tax=Botryobasidium botryosum (strain FD-172 SS1) TaxID=930990 RepID=A0A067M8W3_BOTB1|nr:hypothetical protein BOTBODRAFT_177613 [Botryobasidium botryosum FD-172 SS1]